MLVYQRVFENHICLTQVFHGFCREILDVFSHKTMIKFVGNGSFDVFVGRCSIETLLDHARWRTNLTNWLMFGVSGRG
jgi:hypothetical protein